MNMTFTNREMMQTLGTAARAAAHVLALASTAQKNDALKAMAPRLALQVENTLKGDDTKLSVELNFNKLEDFEPQQIVDQVDPLRQLLEIRTRLSDLRNKIIGNDKLEELLDEIVRDNDKLEAIKQSNPKAGE